MEVVDSPGVLRFSLELLSLGLGLLRMFRVGLTMGEPASWGCLLS